MANISSLASVYHEVPEAFCDNNRRAQANLDEDIEAMVEGSREVSLSARTMRRPWSESKRRFSKRASARGMRFMRFGRFCAAFDRKRTPNGVDGAATRLRPLGLEKHTVATEHYVPRRDR